MKAHSKEHCPVCGNADAELLKAHPIHNHWVDKLAILNAFLSAAALYPQLYSIAILQSGVENLSLPSFWLIFSNNVLWLIYGMHRRLTPLTLSSFFNAVAAGLILLFAL